MKELRRLGMLADVDPLAEMAALNYSGWVDPLPPHVQDPREAFGPLRDPRYGSPPADPNAPPPGSKANPLPAGLGPGPGGSFTDNIAEEMMNYGHPDGGLEIKAIDDEVRRQLHVAAEERGITGDQVIYPGEAVALHLPPKS